MTVLQFINTVRVVTDLPPAVGFDLSRAQRGSETECVLALALGCEISAASDPDVDGGIPQFVMRFCSVDVAQRVAATTGCAWCDPLPAVLLPDTLADIAAAFDDGLPVDLNQWRAAPLQTHSSQLTA